VLTTRLLGDLNPGRLVVIAPELLERLRQHAWPGNLRQYANVLRTASAMLDADETCIDWVHLSDDVQEDLSAQAQTTHAQHAGKLEASRPTQVVPNLQDLAREAMRQAIDSSYGNMSQAARQLGISRQTLYRKLNA